MQDIVYKKRKTLKRKLIDIALDSDSEYKKEIVRHLYKFVEPVIVTKILKIRCSKPCKK